MGLYDDLNVICLQSKMEIISVQNVRSIVFRFMSLYPSEGSRMEMCKPSISLIIIYVL